MDTQTTVDQLDQAARLLHGAASALRHDQHRIFNEKLDDAWDLLIKVLLARGKADYRLLEKEETT